MAKAKAEAKSQAAAKAEAKSQAAAEAEAKSQAAAKAEAKAQSQAAMANQASTCLVRVRGSVGRMGVVVPTKEKARFVRGTVGLKGVPVSPEAKTKRKPRRRQAAAAAAGSSNDDLTPAENRSVRVPPAPCAAADISGDAHRGGRDSADVPAGVQRACDSEQRVDAIGGKRNAKHNTKPRGSARRVSAVRDAYCPFGPVRDFSRNRSVRQGHRSQDIATRLRIALSRSSSTFSTRAI